MFGTKTVSCVVRVFTKAINDLEEIQEESQKTVDQLADQIVTATYERDDATNWLKGLRKLQEGNL